MQPLERWTLLSGLTDPGSDGRTPPSEARLLATRDPHEPVEFELPFWAACLVLLLLGLLIVSFAVVLWKCLDRQRCSQQEEAADTTRARLVEPPEAGRSRGGGAELLGREADSLRLPCAGWAHLFVKPCASGAE
eukprot:scaffold965_cov262-Pinguiococcus_pyrenoidosus.AAC.21